MNVWRSLITYIYSVVRITWSGKIKDYKLVFDSYLLSMHH